MQNIAKYKRCGPSFCSTNVNFSRLWHGLEQTASNIKRAKYEQHFELQATRQYDRGWRRIVYVNALQDFGKAKIWYNTESKGFCATIMHKQAIIC